MSPYPIEQEILTKYLQIIKLRRWANIFNLLTPGLQAGTIYITTQREDLH